VPAVLLFSFVTSACSPRLSAEVVTESVLATAPFSGALAVIVPRTLDAECDSLPDSQESQAWAVLVNAGFMVTTPVGESACALALTDRGAKRRSFGRIVTTDSTYVVPVGGIGTDLPEYSEAGNGDSVTVSFSWKFYRFRGVEGLFALEKLPQRVSGVRIAEVPPAGLASATFRRHDDSWKLEGWKLVQ
jgi:hypothetical protein